MARPHHAVGKGILAFLSALAEDERARILSRANGGRAEAKKRGVKFGPKPKLAPHQEKDAVRMVHAQGLSLRAVAHHYHVGHSKLSGPSSGQANPDEKPAQVVTVINSSNG